MSVKVMSFVWEHSLHKGSLLLLLLAIADHADDEGMAYPSVTKLAKKTRMTDRNVQHCLARLKRSEELQIFFGAGPQGTNLFHVKIPDEKLSTGGGEKFSPQEDCKIIDSHPGGEKFSPGVKSFQGENQRRGGVKPASPKPSEESSEDLRENLKKDSSAVLENSSPPAVKSSLNGYTPWPDEDLALYSWLTTQDMLTIISPILQYDWWTQISWIIGGMPTELFLAKEFSKMQLWLQENPKKKPTPRGISRFIRGWLERAYEQERKNAQSKQNREVHIHYGH